VQRLRRHLNQEQQKAVTRAATILSIVAVVVPLLTTRYLPFTDAPEHAAVMATLRHLSDPAYGGPYELSFVRSQYLAYHFAGAALTFVTGDDAELANRLLLAITGVLFPLSFRSLLRATSRDERLAIFACLPFWSRSLVIGFLPFVASIPIAIFALALFIRDLRSRRTKKLPRSFGLGVIALLLFYTHVSMWLLFVACAVVLAVVTKRPRGLLLLVPSGLMAAVWFVFGKMTLGAEASIAQSGATQRMSVTRSMLLMPQWIFDVWRSHGDEIAAALWWVGFLVVALASAQSIRRFSRGALLFLYAPFVTALVVYLATPFRVGAGTMLNVRLAPILVLFALLPVRLGKGRLATGAIALVLLANVIGGITAFRECRAARRELGDIDGLLAKIPKGARVLTLTTDLRSATSTHIYPWFHVGAYHRVRAGGVASFSFSELQHWPLRYVAGDTRPPQKDRATWDFDPCTYRNAIDGEYYDFVLTRGPLNPFANDPPGPVFEPAFETAGFVLWGKTSDPKHPETHPDLGPCEKGSN